MDDSMLWVFLLLSNMYPVNEKLRVTFPTPTCKALEHHMQQTKNNSVNRAFCPKEPMIGTGNYRV